MSKTAQPDLRRRLSAHLLERENASRTSERPPCPFCKAPMSSMDAHGSMVIACPSCGTMISEELKGRRTPATLHDRSTEGCRHHAMQRRHAKRLNERDVAILMLTFLAAAVAVGAFFILV